MSIIILILIINIIGAVLLFMWMQITNNRITELENTNRDLIRRNKTLSDRINCLRKIEE